MRRSANKAKIPFLIISSFIVGHARLGRSISYCCLVVAGGALKFSNFLPGKVLAGVQLLVANGPPPLG